jgi:hypothetical protein
VTTVKKAAPITMLPVELDIYEDENDESRRHYSILDLEPGTRFSFHYSWHPARGNPSGYRNNAVREYEVTKGLIRVSGSDRDIYSPAAARNYHDIEEIPITEFESLSLMRQAQDIVTANEKGLENYVLGALPALEDILNLYTQQQQQPSGN